MRIYLALGDSISIDDDTGMPAGRAPSQLALKLQEAGLLDKAGLDALDVEVRAEVDAAVRYAEESPDPDPTELHAHVLAD